MILEINGRMVRVDGYDFPEGMPEAQRNSYSTRSSFRDWFCDDGCYAGVDLFGVGLKYTYIIRQKIEDIEAVVRKGKPSAKKLLNYLIKNKHRSVPATELSDCVCLAYNARIAELRKAGYVIHSERVPGKTYHRFRYIGEVRNGY